jgi:glutathione S-transferase
MHLLQFSTSHYCRKARLGLGYKQIPFTVENLTPGLHVLKLKPLTGLTTVPVLLPERPGEPAAIADSTHILRFLDRYQPEPSLSFTDPLLQSQAEMLEDWLDESIGIAARFVYYDYRAGEGKAINPAMQAQIVIQVVRWQQKINPATVAMAEKRLAIALMALHHRWRSQPHLVGDHLSIADIAAAALLSPLALIPYYRQAHPWLFQRIVEVHQRCGELLPPGLADIEL